MNTTVYDTSFGKIIMRWVSCVIFKAAGWKAAGQKPDLPKYVIIAAPHTSNWDFVYTICLAFILDIRPRVMMKSEWFHGPMGLFLRWFGAFPVDRSGSHGVVAESVNAFLKFKEMALVVPPSGTRKKVMYWKTGFYHIAMGAGVPVVLGYLDYRRKIGGIGPTVYLTGRMDEDMKTIQDFYAPMAGRYSGGGFVMVAQNQEK